MIGLLPGLVAQSMDFLKEPPASTLFLLVLAFVVSAITTYISKRSMNVEEYRKSLEESSHAQQELMAAKTDEELDLAIQKVRILCED